MSKENELITDGSGSMFDPNAVDVSMLGMVTVNGQLTESIIQAIAQNEKIIADAKIQQEEYKDALTKLMAENGVTKIENDYFKVSFFPDNEQSKLDSAKVKAEHPEVYIECMKISKTKQFIKIEVKK